MAPREGVVGLSSAEADACASVTRAEWTSSRWRRTTGAIVPARFAILRGGGGARVHRRKRGPFSTQPELARATSASMWRWARGVLLDLVATRSKKWLALASGDPEPQVLEASPSRRDGRELTRPFRATLRSGRWRAPQPLVRHASGRHRSWRSWRCSVSEGRSRSKIPSMARDARVMVEQDGAPTVRYEAPVPTYRRQLEVSWRGAEEGYRSETTGLSIVQTQTMLDRLYLKAGLPARDELARGSRRSATD